MGATETWIHNVRVTIHTENEGPRVLRRGLEPVDEEATLEEAVRSFGGEYVQRQLLRRLEEAVSKVEQSGGPRRIRF